MEYAPQISQGTNRGEAAFLGESSFDPVRASAVFSDQVRRSRQETKQDRDSFQSLLSGNVKSEWDVTSIKHFQPQIEQLRNEGIEIMRTHRGKIPFDVKKQYEAKWENLKNEAIIDNKVKIGYDAQLKALRDHPDKYDFDESVMRLEIFKDPTKDPVAMKDLQENFGGNIVKWRAARAEDYSIQPSFSREQYVQDLTKGFKPKHKDLVDASGKPITVFDPVTKTNRQAREWGVTDEDIETRVNSIYQSTSRKDKKLIESDMQAVQDMFNISDDGVVDPKDMSDSFAIEVLQRAAPRLKGKANKDEIIKELSKAYTFVDIRRRNPVSEQFRNIGKIPQPRQSGGRGNPLEKFIATVTALEDYTEEEAAKITGLGLNSGIEVSRKFTPKGGTYISLSKKGSGQTKEEGARTLLNTGTGEMQLIGFNVRPDGAVLMDYSFTNEINDFLTGKSKERAIVRNYNLNTNPEILTQVANQYGFDKGEDFLMYLNEQAAAKNPKHKVQKPQKQETKVVTKPKSPQVKPPKNTSFDPNDPL